MVEKTFNGAATAKGTLIITPEQSSLLRGRMDHSYYYDGYTAFKTEDL